LEQSQYTTRIVAIEKTSIVPPHRKNIVIEIVSVCCQVKAQILNMTIFCKS